MAEDGDSKKSSAPLLGAILCFTSIPVGRRSELASKAEEMGAIHRLDLTSDVTHLIVGHWDTPKYKYVAKERLDVQIVGSHWIEAVRKDWMNGDDVDIEALEKAFTVPTFAGLKICLTGFEDEDDRRWLTEEITSNGGEWRADLTREVTHLVAAGPAGTKFRYAEKWCLKVVTREWFEDSLERGMILDENSYHPLLPVSERPERTWMRRSASGTSLGKRSRDNRPEAAEMRGRRKLRRTASAKLSVQNSGIWTDIVGGGFDENTIDKPSQGTEGLKDTDTTDYNTGVPNVERKPRIGLEQYEENGKENSCLVAHQTSGISKPANSSNQKHGLFHGRIFYLHGFDEKKTTILQSHLVSHDAKISSTLADLSKADLAGSFSEVYIVVPHALKAVDHPSHPSCEIPLHIVSEWWLERCLHQKLVIDHRADITSSPFQKYPIPGFADITICSTGFSGIDLLHASKTVKILGATYDEFLSRNATVLVCNGSAANQDKIRHATNWRIPAVSASWLWDCARTGKRVPFDSFLISAITQPILVSESSSTTLSGHKAESISEIHAQLPAQVSKLRHITKSGNTRKMLRMKKAPLSEYSKAASKSPDPAIDVSLLNEDGPSFQHDDDNVDAEVTSAISQCPEMISTVLSLEESVPTRQSASPGGSADAPKAPSPSRAASTNNQNFSTPNPLSTFESAPKPSLTAQLASLLSRQATKSGSAAPSSPSKRPIRRLLGRASSTSSSRVLSNPSLDHRSRASSIESQVSAHSLFTLQEPVPSKVEVPEPSQKILYEDAELMAKREKAGERMRRGRKDGEAVGSNENTAADVGKKSIGMVRDVGEVAGVSGRTRRRGKA